MRNIFKIILTVLMISSFILPLNLTVNNGRVEAADVVVDSFIPSAVGISDSPSIDYLRGQSWTAGSSYTLTSIDVLVSKVGSPSGNLSLKIYATDINGKPTGSLLGSATVSPGSITASWPSNNEWVNFNVGDFSVTSGTKYIWYVYDNASPGTDNSSNEYVVWGMNNPSTYSGGDMTHSNDAGSTWDIYNSSSPYGVYDLSFRTYETSSSPSAKNIYYDTNDDSEVQGGPSTKICQSFTTVNGFTLDYIKVKIFKLGSGGGTTTYSIYLADVDNRPTGSVLTSGTIDSSTLLTTPGQFETIEMTNVFLSPSTMYVIQLQTTSNNFPIDAMLWRADASSPSYSGGRCEVYDSGWTTYATIDMMFEVYGASGPVISSVAASPFGITTATLNANLTSLNGSNVDYRGFVWDNTTRSDPGNVAPASSGYSDDYIESGSFAIGTFSYDISSLSSGTTYYFRAFAHNANGYSYGSQLSFVARGKKIISIGDSITYGEGSSGGLSYPYDLQLLLGSGWTVINKGKSGDTTTQMLSRYTLDVLSYTDAGYVIILGGINDIGLDLNTVAQVEANLQSMYTQAHNAGFVVIATTMTPWHHTTYWTQTRQNNLNSVNTWIMNTATNVDYRINIYSPLEDPNNATYVLSAYDSGDQTHYNNAGYSVIANTIASSVTWYNASVISPAVVTYSPSNITSASATFQGNLEDFGTFSSGFYSFDYGLTTSYGSSTTETSITSEGSFNQAITGLLFGTTYHVRAKIRYSTIGYSYGNDVVFTTSIVLPSSPTNFKVSSSTSTSVTLSWLSGSNSLRTMIRYSTVSYPSSISDGTQLYLDSGTNTTQTGLVAGQRVYYSAWGERNGSYSLLYVTVATAATTGGLQNPDVIEITDVKVYKDYASPGDRLFLITYKLLYTTGDPSQDASDYFSIGILEGTTIKSQTRPTMWGYRIAAIEQNSISALAWQGPYTISLKGISGKWGSTIPTATPWVMSSGDWVGSDKTMLAQQIMQTANNIGNYYGSTLTAYTSSGDNKLSSVNVLLGSTYISGAQLISNAIPGIRQYVPSLFTSVSTTLTKPADVAHSQALRTASTIDAAWGAGAEANMDTLGTEVFGGMSGKYVFIVLWAIIALILSMMAYIKMDPTVFTGLGTGAISGVVFGIIMIAGAFLGADIFVALLCTGAIFALYCLMGFIRGV